MANTSVVNKMPGNRELCWPLIEALKTFADCSARPKADDVYGIIARNMNVSPRVLKEKIIGSDGSQRSKFENNIQWAREILKSKGIIDGSVHGRWTLTERGMTMTRDELEAGISYEVDDNDDDVPPEDEEGENGDNEYTKDDFLKDVFIDARAYDTLKYLLENKKNLILTGAQASARHLPPNALRIQCLARKMTAASGWCNFTRVTVTKIS